METVLERLENGQNNAIVLRMETPITPKRGSHETEQH